MRFHFRICTTKTLIIVQIKYCSGHFSDRITELYQLSVYYMQDKKFHFIMVSLFLFELFYIWIKNVCSRLPKKNFEHTRVCTQRDIYKKNRARNNHSNFTRYFSLNTNEIRAGHDEPRGIADFVVQSKRNE